MTKLQFSNWSRVLPVIVFLGCFLAVLPDSAAEDKGKKINPEELSPKKFLAYARTPFRVKAWGRFEGQLLHRRDGELQKHNIYLGLRFTKDFMRGQIVLNDNISYKIHQIYYAEGIPNVRLKKPAGDPEITLKQFGVVPEDMTFSFIYWNFVKEYPREAVRGRACRVFRLQHPEKKRDVKAWFSMKYLFPLKVKWFNKTPEDPSRILVFQSFKKGGKNMWYVKELQLRGSEWKSKIVFEKGELHKTADEKAPPNLFVTLPQEQDEKSAAEEATENEDKN